MTGMMTHMQQEISKATRARSGPTPEFVELCKALYGEAVDPAIVWTDVIKLSPDQADLAARRKAKIRRNVERSSNAVGIAAGTLGLAGSLRDDRLSEGKGRISRGLAATGRKMPKIADRVKSPKVRAAMAATAVGTQVANLGGDALIAGTLTPKRKRERLDNRPGQRRTHSSRQPMMKRAGVLVPTAELEDFEKFGMPKIKSQVAGLRRLWQPKPPGAPPGAVMHGPQTKGQDRVRRAGKDVATAASTTTGKVVGGGIAVSAVNRGRKQSAEPGYEYYGKADEGEVEFRGEFTKFDDEKRQAFGWASVVKIDGQPVIDRQGDYISMEDLEDAAYAYVHKSRVGGDMHRRNGEAAHKVSDMIESMVFTDEKVAKMGLPADFPRGWWVGYKIHDEDTWSEVRKGGRTGFSIHGKGLRKEHSLDELMGY